MCGIHGFCWRDKDGHIDKMIGEAAHRGPDGSGRWGDDRITLGHNLLAIADSTSASIQPWRHGRTVLAYNGEIYNYRELRDTLDYEFKTDSDTEVLAVGLARKGPAFLEKLDGMFAIAFYDRDSRELLLARDTNGAKPLYYGYLNGRLAFSSEIRSLLSLGFDRKVSKEGFRHYYHSGLVAGHLTMFEGISKLVPGQVIRVDKDGSRTTYNLNAAPPDIGPIKPWKLGARLSQRLGQAVRMTSTGYRKSGLLLSGGLDSSSILHELRSLPGGPPTTFSTRFSVPHRHCRHNGDAHAAAILAKIYGASHREVYVDERIWVDNLEASVLALEEPRHGKSYPAYFATLREMSREGVTVVLSGDGGDELLMGYKHQHNTPFANKLRAWRANNRELRGAGLHMTVEEQEDYLNSWLPKAGLTGDPINDFMLIECLHTLSEDFLTRNDKLGMAFGMEARFPMLGRVFRDFVRGIPGHVKAAPAGGQGGWDTNNKVLLREAYRNLLPRGITGKVKTGWRAPTDDWIIGIPDSPAAEGPVREHLRQLLSDPTIRDLFEITDNDVENRYLNNRDLVGPPKSSGKPGSGPGMLAQKELFTIAMFAVWFKAFRMSLW